VNSSQVHAGAGGDQTGRDGGTRKVKEENEPLGDLEHIEDSDAGEQCATPSQAEHYHQPLLKTNPEAADRSPSRSADAHARDFKLSAKLSHGRTLDRLDDSEKRADHAADGADSGQEPELRAPRPRPRRPGPPFIFKPLGFSAQPQPNRDLNLSASTVTELTLQ
jgi:hypothetical protein